MNANQDETLDNERGEAAEALEDLLGPDGLLVNSPNPWDEILEYKLVDVRRLQITYGGPSVYIEVNLSDETGEYATKKDADYFNAAVTTRKLTGYQPPVA